MQGDDKAYYITGHTIKKRINRQKAYKNFQISQFIMDKGFLTVHQFGQKIKSQAQGIKLQSLPLKLVFQTYKTNKQPQVLLPIKDYICVGDVQFLISEQYQVSLKQLLNISNNKTELIEKSIIQTWIKSVKALHQKGIIGFGLSKESFVICKNNNPKLRLFYKPQIKNKIDLADLKLQNINAMQEIFKGFDQISVLNDLKLTQTNIKKAGIRINKETITKSQ